MKKKFYYLSLLGFFSAIMGQLTCDAQTVIYSPIDNFVGKPVHSAETMVFQSYAKESGNPSAMADLLNFNIGTNKEVLDDTLILSNTNDTLQVSSFFASVNLLKLNLGDAGYTDLVYAFANSANGITLAVPTMSKYPLKTTSFAYTAFGTGSSPSSMPRIKMAKADFNGDGIDECVIAYTDYKSNKVMISIYEFDANRKPILKGQAIAGPSYIYSQNEVFDIKTIQPGAQPVIAYGTIRTLGSATPQLSIFTVDTTGSSWTINLSGTHNYPAVGNTSDFQNFALETGHFDTTHLSTEYIAAGIIFIDPNNSSNYIRALEYGTFDANYNFSYPTVNLFMDTVQNFNYLPAISLRAGDLDGVAGDELVFAEDNAFDVFRLNPAGRITKTGTGGNGAVIAGFYNYVNNNYVDIDDLYNDYLNEIIVGFIPDPGEGSTQNVRLDIEQPKDATLSSFNNIYNDVITSAYTSGAGDINAMAVAFGELQGGTAILGAPSSTYKTVFEPLVVLNTPPYHFDTLEGARLDVNGFFGTRSGFTGTSAAISSTYSSVTQDVNTLQTKLKSSWGTSSTLSVGGTLLGAGLKASITANYGQAFDATNVSTTTVTVSSGENTISDDYVYGLVSNFNVYEYPVDSSGVTIGYVMALMRTGGQPMYNWYFSKDAPALFKPDHEVGNILSYSPSDAFAGYVGLIGTYIKSNQAGDDIGQNGSGNANFSMSFADFTSSTVDTTTTFGVDASVSASIWGISLDVKGNYSSSDMTTHTSTASSTITYGAVLDYGINSQLPFSTDDYIVRPSVYWGLNGAINLNYSVDLDIDTLNGHNLWTTYYGHKPDLSLILPWRLDAEKGIPDGSPQQPYLCRSLFFDRDSILPDDTLTITAFIQNYSLVDFNDSAQFQFYIGEPGHGGTLLTDINGNSTLTVPNLSVPHQGRGKISFQTKFTKAYPSIPQIFIVIDPNNLIDEVHEDNNIGTNIVYSGSNSVSSVPHTSFAASIYPNPATDHTQVQIELPEASPLQITLFDIMGQPVKTLYNQKLWPGHFILPIETDKLSAGTYFVKVSTGDIASKTIPLVVIK